MVAIMVMMSTSSCTKDETVTNQSLLNGLTAGNLVFVINGGTAETINCTFNNYSGETSINAIVESSGIMKNWYIMYGNYSNTIPMSVKSYSTAVGADMITINYMSQSSVSEQYSTDATKGASIIIKITEVSATAIKGEFSGKMLKNESTLTDISGAFWAVKSAG